MKPRIKAIKAVFLGSALYLEVESKQIKTSKVVSVEKLTENSYYITTLNSIYDTKVTSKDTVPPIEKDICFLFEQDLVRLNIPFYSKASAN